MVSDNLNVRLTGRLKDHLRQQVGENGLYDNASEYVRDLIRRDLKDREEAWIWLREEIEPGLRAPEDEFVEVSAADVISRNKRR